MTILLQTVALLSLAPGQATTAPRADAAALISKAMARYYSVPSMAGKIRLTQEAKGVSVVLDTVFQIDRPNKIYLHQERSGRVSESFTMVSDGIKFSYDRPGETLGPGRFTEYARQQGRDLTYRDMYTAALRSVIDRSPALELVIGRDEDLEDLRSHLGSKAVTGTTSVDGQDAYIIEGLWHDLPGEQATGKFRLVIGPEGDLYKFVRTQRFHVPDKLKEIFMVTSTWEVNVKIGTKNDESLYKGS